MKKKIIAMGMICSLFITSFHTYSTEAIQNQNIKRQYLVLSRSGSNYNVQTYSLTNTELMHMEQDEKNIIIEEDGYVYGCGSEYFDEAICQQKEPHEKYISIESSKDSDIEWNRQMINTDSIINVSEEKVKVALIDSGVDESTDIDVYKRKNFVPGEDEISTIYEDTSGHGTSIAGIIAAKDNDEGITGINSNVELYSAKVLDANNTSPISRVVEAIYWAIDNEVNIINISFGTTQDSKALKQAITDAYDAGILIIAASGNAGDVEYPAAYDEVVAVGAVNSLGEKSEYSATGESLELVAPGEQIISTGAFGGVGVFTGTSMAAPHVVGVASVLWEKDLTCSSDFIRQLLDITANQYGDKTEYGYGLIDLEYALESYDEFKSLYYSDGIDTISEEEETVDLNNESAITVSEEEETVDLNNESAITVFEDVDYVTGSWGKNTHASILSDTDGLSTSALSVVKLGAQAPDNYTAVAYMGQHPQWHGYTSWVDSDGVKQYCNYMASYIYITQVALGFPKTSTNSNTFTAPSQPSYMSDGDYNQINGIATATTFAGTSWSTILKSYGVTDRNKRLFMYGCAIHTATDLFAHSTSTASGTYINHDLGADDPDYYENRRACAVEMAQMVVDHILAYTKGSIADFADVVSSGTYDGSFKITTYSTKAKLVSATLYKKYQDEFDLMSTY